MNCTVQKIPWSCYSTVWSHGCRIWDSGGLNFRKWKIIDQGGLDPSREFKCILVKHFSNTSSKTKSKHRGFGLRANYADQATSNTSSQCSKWNIQSTPMYKKTRFFLHQWSIEAELQGLFYGRQQINKKTWKFSRLMQRNLFRSKVSNYSNKLDTTSEESL
jgi:hypothetical protein